MDGTDISPLFYTIFQFTESSKTRQLELLPKSHKRKISYDFGHRIEDFLEWLNRME